MPRKVTKKGRSGLKAKSKIKDIPAASANTSLADLTSLREEIESDWRIASMLLARSFHQLACSIHENCDGSCQGFHQEDPPFISFESREILRELRELGSFDTHRVITEETPHDIAWMTGRGFPQ